MRRLIIAVLVVFFVTMPISLAGSIPNPSAFVSSGDSKIIDAIDRSQAGQTLSGILGLIYQVGYGVAIIILFVLAIQVMITPPQKKAEAKAALTPYFIGLLLLVAGVPIATIVIELFTKVF